MELGDGVKLRVREKGEGKTRWGSHERDGKGRRGEAGRGRKS